MGNLIQKDGRLTSQGLNVYVQAMLNDSVDELPSTLYKHVQNSPECIAEVVEAYDWAVELKDEDDWSKDEEL